MAAVRFAARPVWSLRLFSSLLFRLCIFMVAAFGSRPCGVAGIEQQRAPLIVGLRAHHAGDAHERSYDPAAPTLASAARGAPSVRTPTAPNAGFAGLPSAEALTWTAPIVAAGSRVPPIPRRTPCAGCGDGKPYDATAPPASDIA